MPTQKLTRFGPALFLQLLLLLFLLAASLGCRSQVEPAAATAAPTVTSTPSPTTAPPTALPTASATALPTAEPPATASATPPPAATRPAPPTRVLPMPATSPFPAVTAVYSGSLTLEGWSPAGTYLSYWEPGGALHHVLVLDDLQGSRCAYPYPDERLQPHQRRHFWLPGEILAVFGADGSYTTGSSCDHDFIATRGMLPIKVDELVAVDAVQGTVAVRDGERLWLLPVREGEFVVQEVAGLAVSPGDAFAFSPDGTSLAVNHVDGGTTLVATATGDTVRTIPWRGFSGGEIAPLLSWLDAGRLLIRDTTDRGPLLVQDEEVVAVMAELFGRPGASAIAQAANTGKDNYALLALSGEQALLYHSATATVEELPPGYASLDPGGYWLFLTVPGNGIQEAWRRPLAPGAGDFVYLGGDSLLLVQLASPTGTDTAALTGDTVIFADAAGQTTTYFLPGVYAASAGAWSPDGHTLAVQGRLLDETGWAIFLFPRTGAD